MSSPASSPSLQPNSTLGKFRLLELLGEGGMGMVFLAEDSLLKRRVALKVMQPHVAKHPQARQRFLREARSAAQVEHERIVRVHEIGEIQGIPYISMELLPGQSLQDFLDNSPIPNLKFTLEVVRQIAEGLHVAHTSESHLIHRDVKPPNVWLKSHANKKLIDVKLLDFGLARAAEGDSISNQSGSSMGTPNYMSPEQWKGKEVDHRTDIYAVGVMLYQMTTGRLPFEGSPHQIMFLATTQTATPVGELNPNLSEAAVELIRRLMEKDKERRLGDCTELIREIDAIRADLPDELTPFVPPASNASGHETRTLPAEALSPRRRLWPTGVLLLGMLLGVGVLLSLKDAPKSDDPPNRKTDEQNELLMQPHRDPVRSMKPDPLDCTGEKGADEKTVKQAQTAWAEYLGVEMETSVDLGGGVKMEFVLIPPGKFLIGSSKEDLEVAWKADPQLKRENTDDEQPQHVVTITKPFYLGKYEVTQGEYAKLTGLANPSRFKSEPNSERLPVETVCWDDAKVVWETLSKKTLPKRVSKASLPTEAQWEYACRAGTRTPFSFGEILNGDEANGDGNFPFGTTTKGKYLEKTCPVDSKDYSPNAFRLYHMHGNVWEWCQDGYDDKAYKAEGRTDPEVTERSDNRRCLRGGSWGYELRLCRSANRNWGVADYRNANLGFRLLLSLD